MAVSLGSKNDKKAKGGAAMPAPNPARVAALAAAASGNGPWWAVLEHDAAYTVQAKDKPSPDEREDGRPIKVIGPLATEEDADKLASTHYERTLRGWIEASAKKVK